MVVVNWLLGHKTEVALIISEIMALLPADKIKSGGILDLLLNLAKSLAGK